MANELDAIGAKIIATEQELGDLKKQVTAKQFELETFNRDLLIAMGNNIETETPNFRFKRSIPNPSTQSAYKVSSTVSVEDRKKQINWLKINHPELLEEQIKVDNKPIRKMLASGNFKVTDKGKVVDENGQLIPGVFGELKPEQVKFKVLEQEGVTNASH